MDKQKLQKIAWLCTALLLLASMICSGYLLCQNQKLKKQQTELSDYYIQQQLNELTLATIHAGEKDIAQNRSALITTVEHLEQSIWYYEAACLRPVRQDLDNFATAKIYYGERLAALKEYLNAMPSGKEGEITAEDVNAILQDFVTVKNWLQNRVENQGAYYYTDPVFEEEVLPNLTWTERDLWFE